MKKRFLCLIVVLVLGLTACGTNADTKVDDTKYTENKSTNEDTKEDKSKNTNADSTQASIETNETKEAVLDFWVEENLDVPSLPNVSIRKADIFDGNMVDVYTTCIDYNYEQLKTDIRNSKLITDNYDLANHTYVGYDYRYFSDAGSMTDYEIQDCVSGRVKDSTAAARYYTDFIVKLYRQTSFFDNYSSFYMSLSNLEFTDSTQEELYNIVKNVLGDELARFAVYGKDPDEADSENFGLSEKIKTDNVTYKVVRTIKMGEDISDNSIVISFFVDDYKNIDLNVKYSNGYTNPYLGMKYKLDYFIDEKAGDLSGEDINTWLDEYMKIGVTDYTRTKLDYSTVKVLSSDNGTNVYEFDFTLNKTVMKSPDMLAKETVIRYDVVEENGVVTVDEISVEGNADSIKLNGDTDADKEEGKLTSLEYLKKQMDTLFPGIDLSEVTTDNVNKGIESSYVIDGRTYDCKIVISFSIKDGYCRGNYEVQLDIAK